MYKAANGAFGKFVCSNLKKKKLIFTKYEQP